MATECMVCGKQLGFRGYCSQECHDKYYDDLKCNIIDVPGDCCYIRFKKEKVKHSKDIGYTNRGEQMIVDYNKNDEIIGIELLESKEAEKPCQEGNNGKTKNK